MMNFAIAGLTATQLHDPACTTDFAMATTQNDPASSEQPKKILRVGIIGLGEIAQVTFHSFYLRHF